MIMIDQWDLVPIIQLKKVRKFRFGSLIEKSNVSLRSRLRLVSLNYFCSPVTSKSKNTHPNPIFE